MTMGSSSMITMSSIVVVAFLCAVIGGRVVESRVTCNQVVSYLTPCVNYVVGGGNPAPNCCGGVKNLNGMAKTTADRQDVCNCLKSVINGVSYSPGTVANAAALPRKCGINLPYTIDPNVNCRTIK